MSEPRPDGKPFVISKRLVWEAWRRVKANRGAEGVDEESIQAFEANLKGNLYKVWNRMSSGLSIREIADRLGRSSSTVKAYFYDPTGEKARAVKARYVGVAVAAAPTRSHATVRATPTRTASCATPARSGGSGRGSW